MILALASRANNSSIVHTIVRTYSQKDHKSNPNNQTCRHDKNKIIAYDLND
jgi:hypothetical protein